jgi:hypothetical protein
MKDEKLEQLMTDLEDATYDFQMEPSLYDEGYDPESFDESARGVKLARAAIVEYFNEMIEPTDGFDGEADKMGYTGQGI